MLKGISKCVALAALAGSMPLLADSAEARVGVSQSRELPPYLQCVPYAREVSGISIYGDAHTWWKQAKGKFKRGNRPKVGAVMAFQPHGNMRLGHVAAVSKIVNSRTVLLRHSNWSPINGRRGQIENDVRAVDVSPNNDWSQVRVWYHPIQALGKTAWPIHGFIYSDKAPKFETPSFVAPKPRMQIASAPATKPVTRKTSRAFTNAFADLSAKPVAKTTYQRPRSSVVAQARPSRGTVNDRVSAAVSLYD